MDATRVGPRTSRLPGPVEDDRWEGRTRLNARRAVRLGWGKFLGGFAWQMMATLTFDPRRSQRSSEAHVSREVFWWCGQVGRLNRRPIAWAYAVEGGGGGWLHAHALLIGCLDESWTASKAIWQARNGHINLRRTYDPAGAAAYLCKAIGPNGEIVLSDTVARYRIGAERRR